MGSTLKSKKVIYISGPMTGIAGFNHEEFDKAKKDLDGRGYAVLSPADHDRDCGIEGIAKPSPEWLQEAFIWDIQSVLASDNVYMLHGWDNSYGATLEHEVAIATGKFIIYQDDEQPVAYQWPELDVTKADESVMQEAHRLVRGDRQACYGHPRDDFARTAKLVSAILGTVVTTEQIPLIQIAVKISRECNAHKRDNLVDICGYGGTLELLYDD